MLRRWFGLVRNQDEVVAPAKETDGAYRCQRVPNDATLVLLPPVTTGSEEDPGTPAGRLDPGSSPASRGDPGVSVICAVVVVVLAVTPFFRKRRKDQSRPSRFERYPGVSQQ